MIGIAGTLKNIFGDQGNMQRNFWEHWNLTKVNFREHLNLLLGNKAETPISSVLLAVERGRGPWERGCFVLHFPRLRADTAANAEFFLNSIRRNLEWRSHMTMF